MKSVLQLLLVTILFTLSSVWGQAQTTSTPFTHRDISGELLGEWSFSWLDAEEDKDEYMFIAANKDRDRLFVFVSKPADGAYTQSRFEEAVNHYLDGAKNISISKAKELTLNKQKVYKTNVYQDGELFRIAYGSIVDNIEYYVLLDLLNPKQADQLFLKVRINQAKPNLILPNEEDRPLSELKEIYPNSDIPKNAIIRKLGNIQIWFDADDLVKVDHKVSEGHTETIAAVSLNMNDGIPLGIAIAITDLSHKGYKTISQAVLKKFILEFLSGLTDMNNINFQELEAGLFHGKFCYSTIGYLNGKLERKMIIFSIGSKIYFCYTAEVSDLNIANKLLSKISIVE